jgi:hypothetical protein
MRIRVRHINRPLGPMMTFLFFIDRSFNGLRDNTINSATEHNKINKQKTFIAEMGRTTCDHGLRLYLYMYMQ